MLFIVVKNNGDASSSESIYPPLPYFNGEVVMDCVSKGCNEAK